jgi:hypothetical protein
VRKASDENTFKDALSQMESAAMNFAVRFINDNKVRLSYIHQTRELARNYQAIVASKKILPADAAKQVHAIRNDILEAHRLRASDIGRAKAIHLKATGLTWTELINKYSEIEYRELFKDLTKSQKNQVYLKIIEGSGRQRAAVNASVLKYARLGQGLVVVTVGIAIYNIVTAEDKLKATAKEGVVVGGGFAGGAAGGALAGLACGPGAPACVTIGVFVGGALGALGADISFGWIFGEN